jgi:MscS family membrane protein
MDSMPTQQHRGRAFACLLVIALSFAATPAGAQPVSTPALPPGELKADTPRAGMRGYLEACRAGDYAAAAEYLDLRALPPAARGTRGPILARELKAVLDQSLWVDLDAVSDVPEGDRDDGLPAQRELVGTIDTEKGPVPLLLERVRGKGGTLLWKIAAATVAQIPALYEEVGYGALADYLPSVFFQIQVLDLQLWQWVGLLLLVGAVAAVSWVVTAVILRLARPVVSRSRTTWDEQILALAVGPLRLIVAVALFSAGTYPLGLAIPVQAFLGALQKAVTIIAVTWLLVRAVGAIARSVEDRLVARGQALALSVVPLGRRTVQVLIIGLASLAVLQNLGVNVTGLLAGLGLGGLAVALAAQKTVENLFGGITLIADQPVRVGDFCRFDGKLGTVEEVGLRSTRVRTLDRTLVTIPNAAFSAMQLENFSKRDRIWFHTTLGLRYETTPDQLRYVLIELKRLLLSHPKVDPDPARPRFVGFGAYSLDIELFAYIKTNDYNQFLAIQEDLLLRIMDLVEASGSGFAFPSQTLYAAKDTGLDAQKGRAAETQVQQWRESGLGLPHIRPEQLAAWRDTLQYPPQGSAVGG